MNAQLILGASIYWSAVGFRYLGAFAGAGEAPGTRLSAVKYAVFVIVILSVYLTARKTGVLRARTIFSLAALVSSLFLVCAAVSGCWVGSGFAHLILASFVIGSSMVLWGLAFASLDKRRAAQNVVVTVLSAVAIMVAGSTLSKWLPFAWQSYACFAVSSAFLCLGQIPCASHARTLVVPQGFQRALVVGQRLVFGLALGLCAEIGHHISPVTPDNSLAFVSLVVLAVSLVLAIRSQDCLQTILPVLLLAATGMLFLPFFEGGIAGAAWASAGIIWIAWSAFSAVQLSDLKERYGVSELDICLADKLLLSAGFLASVPLEALLGTVMGDAGLSHTGEMHAFVVVLALVLGSTYAMVRLVSERREDVMRDELARTREERLDEAYNRLALEAGLSKRECEVMKMLAKGYTSAYICEELGFSTGTAKAHASHIYQKLGIHRKNELLELVEKRVAQS